MNNNHKITILFFLTLLAYSGIACQPTEKEVIIDPTRLAAFKALPETISTSDNSLTPEKIELGKNLFNEKKLSLSGEISCNTCHGLKEYGVDHQPTSTGHQGHIGARNAPTVYNAAGHIAQFWDGRSPTVEQQAKGPILNPGEMAMKSAEDVVAVLKSIPEDVTAFQKAFPNEADPVTFDNYAKAVGAFERTLTTPSRFDKFINGDKTALSNAEKAGFNKFVETGCVSCHNGSYVGGQMFQKLGMVIPYPDQSDLGRYEVTKNEADKMIFKVPSLRNIEKTAPYFHNGKVATLNEAVRLMGKHQLGKDLSDADVESIITWLKTLTGDVK